MIYHTFQHLISYKINLVFYHFYSD